jgi:hypothetical protein
MKWIVVLAMLSGTVLLATSGCTEGTSPGYIEPMPIFRQLIHLSASASITDSNQHVLLRVTGEPRYTTTGTLVVAAIPFGCLEDAAIPRWIMVGESADTFATTAPASYVGRIYVEQNKPLDWTMQARLLSPDCTFRFAVDYYADSIWSASKGAFVAINSPEAIREYSLNRRFEIHVDQPASEIISVMCK